MAALRLTVDGPLTGEHVDGCEVSFSQQVGAFDGNEVILDLRKTTSMDSRGIAVCIGVFRECEKRGFSFSIEAEDQMYRLLTMINLDKAMTIREVPR